MQSISIYIILAILMIIVIGKWVVFFISAPAIRFLCKRKMTSRKYGKSNNSESITPPRTRHILKTLMRYMRGYIRYMDLQVGLIPSHHIRRFIYKNIFLLDIGKDVVIYYGSEMRAHPDIHIGQGSIIGDKAILDGRHGGIYIGRNVNISSNVCMWTEQHDYNDPHFRCTECHGGEIRIGDRVWIGPNVTILHNVTIGEGAVVAAGAVVTKDVPPFTLVSGIPAKPLGKERNRDLKYEFDGNYIPFY